MYDNLIEVVETEPEETKEPMNYSEKKTFIPEYQELYLQNNDMVGWIKVEDTKINYPVMQSKDNPNFYLKHGFDKAYTDYGCPYVQENCDMELPSDNIIIYGHHMNDGSMFAGLMKFKIVGLFFSLRLSIDFGRLFLFSEVEICRKNFFIFFKKLLRFLTSKVAVRGCGAKLHTAL